MSKKNIPLAAWSLKYHDGKPCYVIKNEVYCRVFWLDFWFNYMNERFRQQNMVTALQNLDTTLPVMISEDLHLVNAPKIIQNVDYYANPPSTVESPFYLNIKLIYIFIIAIISFLTVMFVTFTFGKNSVYSDLV